MPAAAGASRRIRSYLIGISVIGHPIPPASRRSHSWPHGLGGPNGQRVWRVRGGLRPRQLHSPGIPQRFADCDLLSLEPGKRVGLPGVQQETAGQSTGSSKSVSISRLAP